MYIILYLFKLYTRNKRLFIVFRGAFKFDRPYTMTLVYASLYTPINPKHYSGTFISISIEPPVI